MAKIPFEKLNKSFQVVLCTTPMSTPTTVNPDDETSTQLIKTRDQFLTLPENIKEILSSNETSEKIKNIGGIFNLELLQIASISRAIRNYYFEELKLEDIPFVLAKEIPIDFSKAKEITKLVIEKIINDKSYEQAYQARLENLPLTEALKKYPELGEQLITLEKITLKNFPEPVRPSLKNWLADYTFTLGHEKHDAVQRGNYLFQSGNTKRLASGERQKLAYLLKAFDEGAPVTINKETKQLIFPQPAEFARQTANPTQSSVRFSSPQKLPYEKSRFNQPGNVKKEERQPLPNNVVNLKDNF